MKHSSQKGIRFILALIIIALALIVVRVVDAGSLSPGSAPAATLKTLQGVYDPLASISFDSSGVSASSTGSAVQLMNCIITKVRGGTCL
jgi:hypothetical protein